MTMSDKDKFINLKDLKAKLRYWCKSRGASKGALESLIETVKHMPYTVRSDISCTLEVNDDWIFCKDRQPDKDGLYLVTYERYFTPDHIDEIDHVTDIGIKSYFADSYGWGIEKVHAWRKLPDMAIIGDKEEK